jgi:P pilus assembly chaperone PapD
MALFRRNLVAAKFSAALLLGLPVISLAASDLMVYPTRIVMTDRQRSAQVDIVNTSQVQATFQVTMVKKRMTETGEVKDVTEPQQDEKFADDLVRYSPRQVTLVPGASQTIRLMFKAPANLPEGEYRSHLLFTKAQSAISDLSEKMEVEGGGISMRIPINIGVSIPVIARHGTLTGETAIDPASIKLTRTDPKQQILTFAISRSGTRSVFGDVAVYRGEEKVAGLNGIAIYTPNTKRKVAVQVVEPFRLQAGDDIKVVFTERDDKKPAAEARVHLP